MRRLFHRIAILFALTATASGFADRLADYAAQLTSARAGLTRETELQQTAEDNLAKELKAPTPNASRIEELQTEIQARQANAQTFQRQIDQAQAAQQTVVDEKVMDTAKEYANGAGAAKNGGTNRLGTNLRELTGDSAVAVEQGRATAARPLQNDLDNLRAAYTADPNADGYRPINSTSNLESQFPETYGRIANQVNNSPMNASNQAAMRDGLSMLGARDAATGEIMPYAGTRVDGQVVDLNNVSLGQGGTNYQHYFGDETGGTVWNNGGRGGNAAVTDYAGNPLARAGVPSNGGTSAQPQPLFNVSVESRNGYHYTNGLTDDLLKSLAPGVYSLQGGARLEIPRGNQGYSNATLRFPDGSTAVYRPLVVLSKNN